MAETYKPIFPGNFVNHINAWGIPNDSFRTNGRGVGDPRDRRQQAILIAPGWLAVRKVGYAKITGSAGTVFDFVIGSPDMREGDKPRADITGLFIPTGAAVYRAGFRVLPLNANPGYYSQGARDKASGLGSGIAGTNTDFLALASAAITTKSAGSIGATAIKTSTDNTSVTDPPLLVAASGVIPTGVQRIQTAYGSPVVTTADLTLRLYSVATAGNTAGSNISSSFLGGVYVVGEVCYLVPEEVAGLDTVRVPGAPYTGFTG